MTLYVVSDLHISSIEDPHYQSLLFLLNERVGENDSVVLAGDIFDLFVGHKRVFRQRYREFFKALHKASTTGAQIYYLEGNHDFLIRKGFRDLPRVEVISEDKTLVLHGKKFFFAHGDRANDQDYGYRVLRAFLRSPMMKVLLTIIPGQWLDVLGRWSSQYSRGRKPQLPRELPTAQLEALRKIYRSYAAEKIARGYDFVVLGHCHDLDEMTFQVGSRMGQYINVGFPPVHGSFLTWSPEDELIQRERFGIVRPPLTATPEHFRGSCE